MQPYYEDGRVTIYHGDALDVLPVLGGVDLVVTDPPYTTGIASSMERIGKTGGWGDLMNAARWYKTWLQECDRLTANRSGALWCFTSWRTFPVLARAAYLAEWALTSLLVWNKKWIGPGGMQGLRPAYELVGLFCQPEFAVLDRGIPDVRECKWGSHKPHGHGAEKPQELVQWIVQVSGLEEGVVLDPFMGSGTTLAAAVALERRVIGIEIEERWCEVAVERLQQMVLPGLGGV